MLNRPIQISQMGLEWDAASANAPAAITNEGRSAELGIFNSYPTSASGIIILLTL